ncbi:uncharacterized protein DUF4065 [Cricetibacter osteomyelitidis]|uniref:Uncharacterized protein DUF4065 n=1 Tax=Cricetibacter osteomyelitidis TaxID=1521931 RepID=A0A4R2T1V1_9PAST|nr:Panacea domain-containing protein [Cricetibacter osteomyelitidis]TCP95341.1 uncharacterized protein DUF4065 [Cricetibacter osteomyelitidis]
MFNELKTAQATAYLLHKAGGTMHYLKMMKLLYFADRLSWQKRDYSITGDSYYSLPYGPVLSNTLNLLRDETMNRLPTVWNEWIADREEHRISIKKTIDWSDEYALDNLSDSDEKILDETFLKYGHLDRFQLVELTHDPKIVPEWKDPKGGAIPIKLSSLLAHLDRSKEQIKSILADIEEQKHIDRLFKGL